MLVTGGSHDSMVKVFEVATGRELHSFTLPGAGSVPSVEFDPTGRTVVASGPGSAFHAIELATGKVTVIDKNIGWVAEYRFSPDGRYMAAGSTRGVILWDTRTWKEIRRVGEDTATGSRGHVAFSRDSRYVAAIDSAGALHFWETATGFDAGSVGSGLRDDGHVEFMPDGRVLAAGADGTIRVFGPRRGK